MHPADIVYKDAAFEVKDVDEKKGIISGYAAAYGNVDDGGDIIEPGAGAKTIQERKSRIQALYGHDFGKLVGHPLELNEDENGLHTVTKLAITRSGQPGGFWANEVYALALNGTLKEMSIGYATIGNATRIDPDTGVRRIGEYKLYEYSFVPLAMNPRARIDADGVKALAEMSPEQIAAYIEQNARKWDAAMLTRAHTALSAALDSVGPIVAKAANTPDAISPDQRAAILRRIDIARLSGGRNLVGV